MKFLRPATFGLALALGASSAHAQNVISRQVVQEPVETTVTETPGGTVITRRPLAPAVGAITIEPGVAPPREIGTVELRAYPPYPPAAAPTYIDETVGAAPAVRTVTVQSPAATRTTTRVRLVRKTGAARSATRTVQRSTIRRTAVRRVVAPPLVLDPAQRQVVYRTVVQEQVLPAPTPYPGYPPYPAPARAVTVAPAATTGYAVRMPSDADFDDVYAEQVPSAIDPVRYTVGAQLPAGVVLTPLPATAAVRVPSVRPYSYVTIANRVLLVDPVTNTVVADVTP
jgi:hypothetical protein